MLLSQDLFPPINHAILNQSLARLAICWGGGQTSDCRSNGKGREGKELKKRTGIKLLQQRPLTRVGCIKEARRPTGGFVVRCNNMVATSTKKSKMRSHLGICLKFEKKYFINLTPNPPGLGVSVYFLFFHFSIFFLFFNIHLSLSCSHFVALPPLLLLLLPPTWLRRARKLIPESGPSSRMESNNDRGP